MSEQEADRIAVQAIQTLTTAGLDVSEVVRVLAPEVLELQVCRTCGCTDITTCEDGCWWVEEAVCSSCVESTADREEGA